MKASNFVRLAVALSVVLCGWSLCLGTYARPKPAAPGYHLIKTIPLPSAPGNIEYFDYLTMDPEARRVYVSHGTEVVVLDADDYSVVGKIGGLELCHGVVVIKELGKGYITDGEAQKVVVFDLKTLKTTGEIKTNQPDTDSLIYEPVSKHIFTFNGHSHNTTVIDRRWQGNDLRQQRRQQRRGGHRRKDRYHKSSLARSAFRTARRHGHGSEKSPTVFLRS
jgi:hypothetical protein